MKHELPKEGPEKTDYSFPVDDYMYKLQVVDYDNTFDWNKEEEEILQTVDQMQ